MRVLAVAGLRGGALAGVEAGQQGRRGAAELRIGRARVRHRRVGDVAGGAAGGRVDRRAGRRAARGRRRRGRAQLALRQAG